jgi:hypothetical protein
MTEVKLTWYVKLTHLSLQDISANRPDQRLSTSDITTPHGCSRTNRRASNRNRWEGLQKFSVVEEPWRTGASPRWESGIGCSHCWCSLRSRQPGRYCCCCCTVGPLLWPGIAVQQLIEEAESLAVEEKRGRNSVTPIWSYVSIFPLFNIPEETESSMLILIVMIMV